MTDTSDPAGNASPSRVVGSRAGDYELVYDLGARGDAHAFLARSKGANGIVRVVLLDFASAAMTEKAGGASSIVDAVAAASKVKSLNVVAPQEAKDDGGVMVVSEPVDGAPLREVLAAAKTAGETIGVDVALRVVVDALSGLNAAHQTKPTAAIHGGVTPDALVIASEGTTKVIDIALARFRTDPARAEYALSADESASVGNDIFAVGVVAWELLTGARLFGGESPAVTRGAEIPAVSTRASGISTKLDAAIAKALATDPASRFATAAEFSRAIETSGTKVALRSAVGALVTKLLKESLTQRRDLVRKLRTAPAATSAARAVPASAGVPAGAPTLRRPTLPPPGVTPAKLPEGMKRAGTMIGMPRLPNADVAVDANAPAKGAEVPTASTFGAPLIAPSATGSTPPAHLAPAPAAIAMSKGENTMPLDVDDVVSVPANAPAPPSAKKSADGTMPIDLAEVTEVAAGMPAGPQALTTPPATPAAAARPLATPVDEEIAVEEYESLPPSPPVAPTAPVVARANASVPAAAAALTPIGEGFDDDDAKRAKPSTPTVLATQSINGLDDDIELPKERSRAPLYLGIAAVAVIIGGIAFAMRGGGASSTASGPSTATVSEPVADAQASAVAPAATDASVAPAIVAAAVPAAPEAPAAAADAGAIAPAVPTAAAVDAGAAPTNVAAAEIPPPAVAEAPPPAPVTAAPAAPAAPVSSVHRASHTAPRARSGTHRASPPAHSNARATTHPTHAPAHAPARHTAPPPPSTRRREFRPGGL